MAHPGEWEGLGEDPAVPGRLTRTAVSLVPAEDRSESSAAALNLATGSIGSINMSVDIDGTTYAGEALGAARQATVWQPWLVPLVTLPSEPLPRVAFLHVVSRFQR